MIRVLASTCPDCGRVCSHALTRSVDCETCHGKGRIGMNQAGSHDEEPDIDLRCGNCNGTGKVSPPPPTDEQIFGRECACRGSGWLDPGHSEESCHLCNGAGRVGAAENRWTCLGYKDPTCPVADHAPTFCAYCRHCPGRTDIIADPALWEEVKRAWRTRTKTTIVNGIPMYGRSPSVVSGERGALKFEPLSIYHLMPDGTQTLKGKRTITVTFEPDPPQHEHVWIRQFSTHHDSQPAKHHEICVVCDEERIV